MHTHINRIIKNGAALSALAAVLLIGCDANRESAAEAQTPSSESASGEAVAQTTQCTALETRTREVEDYQPSFAGQTRICGVKSEAAVDVMVVAKGLELPWSVEPLPDGSLLVTEKPGQMRIVSAEGKIGEPLAGVLPVDARGQGGLLDAALSPGFENDRTIYWSFTEPRKDGNGTSVARGVLSADSSKLENVRLILRTQPTYTNNMHYGSRLAFDKDGMLYVTTGERSDLETRPQAQQLNSHFGKVLRIQPDGSPAPGNPYIDQKEALPEIWSYGHRNIQASAIDEKGRLWTIEHGPRGGDEVNLPQAGKNYGWPLITYGKEYSGAMITNATTQREGLEQPVYYWDPVIAPSGAQFYTGDLFPEWRNNLFVGAMKETRLVRLVIEDDRVVGEEHLLADRGQRIRDVRQGPEGALYVAADNGEIWKIVPKK